MSVVQFRPWPPLPRAGNRLSAVGAAFIAGVIEEMGLGPFFYGFFGPICVTANTKTLISDVLTANGYELIEAEHFAGRELWRVFIDRPESRSGIDLINLDDCSAMSAKIEDALIASEIPYEHLEVSSPGMDRALTKPDHFSRFSGETVKLTIEPAFEGLRKLTGVLVGLDCDQITIDVDGAVNKIPYAHVARARVVPQY